MAGIGSTVKGLFTTRNAIIFVVIILLLVGLELIGAGIAANADRVRELRARNEGGT